MGTAAGFFGLTYQGAVNGLASNTLSIFNMDHPNDRAWLKLSFDFVAPDDKLRSDQVTDLLQYFYKGRAEGPTQSGSYVHSYPENEATMLRGLCTEAGAERAQPSQGGRPLPPALRGRDKAWLQVAWGTEDIWGEREREREDFLFNII